MKKAPLAIGSALILSGILYLMFHKEPAPSKLGEPETKALSRASVEPKNSASYPPPREITASTSVTKNNLDQNVSEKLSNNLDEMDFQNQAVKEKLLVSIVQGEVEGEELTDYLFSQGPKGYPLLGALAGRIRVSDPDQYQYIVHFLFNSLLAAENQDQVSLIAGSLYNAGAEHFVDDLYQAIQNEKNSESRYKLFGALTGKQLNPEDKKRFLNLAMSDQSPEVKELGKNWDKYVEGKQ